MKGPIVLSPLGTARAGIGVTGQPDAELDLLGWLGHIREQLRTLYNMEEEVAFLAWELARWQAGLDSDERQALILLILTALIQERQGSTRIAFRNAEGRALRRKLAKGLLGSDEFTSLQAVDRIETMIDSGRAGTIIGTAKASSNPGRRRAVPLPPEDAASGRPVCRSPPQAARRRHSGLVRAGFRSGPGATCCNGPSTTTGVQLRWRASRRRKPCVRLCGTRSRSSLADRERARQPSSCRSFACCDGWAWPVRSSRWRRRPAKPPTAWARRSKVRPGGDRQLRRPRTSTWSRWARARIASTACSATRELFRPFPSS